MLLCPQLKQAVDFFKMEKMAVRLLKLNAGAVIKAHKNHELRFEEEQVRINIPVSTNAQLAFYLDEEALLMTAGSCWYLDLTLSHRVDNFGKTDRIHLVIDGIVNPWVHDYFLTPVTR